MGNRNSDMAAHQCLHRLLEEWEEGGMAGAGALDIIPIKDL